MATVTVRIIVSDLEAVLITYDRIKVYRSTTGIDGAYAEVTGPSSRIPLETTSTVYKFVDTDGDADYWYRVAYYHSTTGAESDQSDPQQGEGDPALDILSVDEFKTNYLFGLDLTNDDGVLIPDTAFEFYIKSAVATAERELDIAIVPTVVEDERHDFIEEDYARFNYLQLDRLPVQSVESLELWLPSEQKVIEYDLSWIHVLKHSGQLHIIPATGALSVLGTGGALSLSLTGNKFIPLTFRVSYTAGYPKGKVPADIREIIGKLASFGPLNVFGDITLGSGLQSQSLSIDGLSESVTTTNSSTNAGFGARLLQYQKELKRTLPIVRRALHPIGFAVV
jgi:hypothetical protein